MLVRKTHIVMLTLVCLCLVAWTDLGHASNLDSFEELAPYGAITREGVIQWSEAKRGRTLKKSELDDVDRWYKSQLERAQVLKDTQESTFRNHGREDLADYGCPDVRDVIREWRKTQLIYITPELRDNLKKLIYAREEAAALKALDNEAQSFFQKYGSRGMVDASQYLWAQRKGGEFFSRKDIAKIRTSYEAEFERQFAKEIKAKETAVKAEREQKRIAEHQAFAAAVNAKRRPLLAAIILGALASFLLFPLRRKKLRRLKKAADVVNCSENWLNRQFRSIKYVFIGVPVVWFLMVRPFVVGEVEIWHIPKPYAGYLLLLFLFLIGWKLASTVVGPYTDQFLVAIDTSNRIIMLAGEDIPIAEVVSWHFKEASELIKEETLAAAGRPTHIVRDQYGNTRYAGNENGLAVIILGMLANIIWWIFRTSEVEIKLKSNGSKYVNFNSEQGARAFFHKLSFHINGKTA